MPNSIRLAVTIAALAVATGCANWPDRGGPTSNATQSPEERRAAAIQAFEEQRDLAQLESALDRFSQGDVAGCEARLRALLARRPQDAELHARLAELAWACGNLPDAEAEYRSAIALAPQRGDFEHALGTLLEAAGRANEAAPHLARAAQLDPDSALARR